MPMRSAPARKAAAPCGSKRKALGRALWLRGRHEQELLAVLDDAMKALARNGIGQREQEEVLYILYSMKGDILHG